MKSITHLNTLYKTTFCHIFSGMLLQPSISKLWLYTVNYYLTSLMFPCEERWNQINLIWSQRLIQLRSNQAINGTCWMKRLRLPTVNDRMKKERICQIIWSDHKRICADGPAIAMSVCECRLHICNATYEDVCDEIFSHFCSIASQVAYVEIALYYGNTKTDHIYTGSDFWSVRIKYTKCMGI